MWCSQMRAIVHAAVSRTCTCGSFISAIMTPGCAAAVGFIARLTSSCSAPSDGPSRIEPKASVDASRRCQSGDWMCASTKAMTGATTASRAERAQPSRHVADAVAMFHESSSSTSSSCLHSASSSSGTSVGTAPRT